MERIIKNKTECILDLETIINELSHENKEYKKQLNLLNNDLSNSIMNSEKLIKQFD